MTIGVELDFVVKDSKAALDSYKAIFDIEATNFKVGKKEEVNLSGLMW